MRPCTSPQPTTDATVAARAKGLVQWAVARRVEARRYGWCRMGSAADDPLRFLQTWLAHNPHPSLNTMRELWRQHHIHIRIVMPGNKAGKARLQQLDQLLH